MRKPLNDRSPAGEPVAQSRRQATLARRRARRGLGASIMAQRRDEPEWRGQWRGLKFL